MQRKNVISLIVICVISIGLAIALKTARKGDENLQTIGERGVRITAGMTAEDVMGYKTKTFTVSGNDDPFWQSTIETALTNVKGTQGFSRFDPGSGTVSVVYDPRVTSEATLAAALDATKFKVQP